MNVQDAVFIGIAAITLLAAFLAVWLKNVFSNALSLILCLFGMAALFIYLNAEFLAVIQVIIYIGAISIAIIFAIMLSRPWFHPMPARNKWKLLRSVLTASLLFAGLSKVSSLTKWPSADMESDHFSMREIGKSILTTYALPFEVVSLVLLVAIIGALVISSSNREKAGS